MSTLLQVTLRFRRMNRKPAPRTPLVPSFPPTTKTLTPAEMNIGKGFLSGL